MARIGRIFYLSMLALSVLTLSVHAADAEKTPNYGRYVFSFKEPVKLKTSTNGATATLEFNKPVHESAAAISKALPGYVRYAVVSEDKKRVTLTLYQPYRVRQFISSGGVGIDLVGTPADDKAKNADASKPSEPSDAKKMAAVEPSAANSEPPTPEADKTNSPPVPVKPTAPATPSPVKTDALLTTKAPDTATTDAPPPAKASTKSESLLTTKSTTPQPQPKREEKKPETPVMPAPAPTPPPAPTPLPKQDSMLSTKPAVPVTPPAPSPKPATQQATTAANPAKPDPMLSTKASAAIAPASAIAAQKPEPPKTAATTKPDASSPATMHPTEATAKTTTRVTVKNGTNDTSLTFPWSERTALAAFRRSRDIWVIFSRATTVDLASLRPSLPKQIINVVQYNYEGNTVIRFMTDGSLNVGAGHVKGNYNWNVVFTTKQPDPVLDVSLSADTLDGTTRLVLGVFDVSPTVKFYDPTIGDMLMVIPSYENGRGVNPPRSFPEFSMLPSNQGVAMVSKRLDLITHQTRSGLIISAPGGLAISDTLPTLSTDNPAATASGIPSVMMPYNQWHIKGERLKDTLIKRTRALSQATKADRPARLFDLAKIYLAEGMMAEAEGILTLIKEESPAYYVANRFALLHGACYVLLDRYDDAQRALDAPELKDMEEAILWRQALALNTPPASIADSVLKPSTPTAASNGAAAPINAANAANLTPQAGEPMDSTSASGTVFQLLKFNKQFIRFYPPRIRQQLTVIAADAYIRDKQPEKALAAFDILTRDGLSTPVINDEKLALAATAVKKGQIDAALELYDAMAKQTKDRRVAVKARYAAAMLRYDTKKTDGPTTADELENIRITWRGRPIEHDILEDLIRIYIEQKRYDQVLRTQKAMLDSFPDDPNTLKRSAEMSDLFQHIFLDGLGDDLDPLKALSLFYEFRELTPLGNNGDRMIQKLADRLASVDLLSRATQLLEHQIKFRLTGEQRSRVGTRLALLYLLNKQPNEALTTLEVTNFGGNKPELQTQRQQLLAAALSALGKNEEALNALYQDRTPEGANLRLEILWTMQDWPNVANRAEDILTSRPNLTDPLTPKETETLLKLALAYTFQGDYVQLRYLRDYYSGLIPNSGYKQIFDYITNDTAPLDPDDFKLVSEQISHTEDFLGTFKTKIARGQLSEIVK